MTRAERLKALHSERLRAYKNHRNAVGEKLLRAALRALATIDANDGVGRILDRLGRSEKLDQRSVIRYVDLIMGVEFATILAQHSTMSQDAIVEFTRRAIAQLIPTKDDVVVPVASPVSDRRRIQAMEEAMKQEMRRIEQQSRKEK